MKTTIGEMSEFITSNMQSIKDGEELYRTYKKILKGLNQNIQHNQNLLSLVLQNGPVRELLELEELQDFDVSIMSDQNIDENEEFDYTNMGQSNNVFRISQLLKKNQSQKQHNMSNTSQLHESMLDKNIQQKTETAINIKNVVGPGVKRVPEFQQVSKKMLLNQTSGLIYDLDSTHRARDSFFQNQFPFQRKAFKLNSVIQNGNWNTQSAIISEQQNQNKRTQSQKQIGNKKKTNQHVQFASGNNIFGLVSTQSKNEEYQQQERLNQENQIVSCDNESNSSEKCYSKTKQNLNYQQPSGNYVQSKQNFIQRSRSSSNQYKYQMEDRIQESSLYRRSIENSLSMFNRADSKQNIIIPDPESKNNSISIQNEQINSNQSIKSNNNNIVMFKFNIQNISNYEELRKVQEKEKLSKQFNSKIDSIIQNSKYNSKPTSQLGDVNVYGDERLTQRESQSSNQLLQNKEINNLNLQNPLEQKLKNLQSNFAFQTKPSNMQNNTNELSIYSQQNCSKSHLVEGKNAKNLDDINISTIKEE